MKPQLPRQEEKPASGFTCICVGVGYVAIVAASLTVIVMMTH
jgi:hypothetical protein